MTEENLYILTMVDEGELSVPEAIELLQAIREPDNTNWLVPAGDTITVQFCLN